jgi:hypothetical protein
LPDTTKKSFLVAFRWYSDVFSTIFYHDELMIVETF